MQEATKREKDLAKGGATSNMTYFPGDEDEYASTSSVAGGRDHGPIDDSLLVSLETIGRIKSSLPIVQRWWCNRLGLYVRLRERTNSEILKAGDQNSWHFDAWRQSATDLWDIKKYDKGDWERLVNPTLQIATWIAGHTVTEENVISFVRSIDSFKETGTLSLP